MVYVLITHSVDDFATWKPVYDAYQLEPSNPRSKGDLVFQSTKDPNLVTVLSEFENRDAAEEFTKSEELRTAMHDAGVTSEPEIAFLEKV